MSQIYIFIPAFNEQDTIGHTLNSIKNAGFEGTIIVVDDGSTDNTRAVAESHEVRVFNLPENSGKGRALKTAISSIAQEENFQDDDIIVFLDADLIHSASESLKLVDELKKLGPGHFVIAQFPPAKRKGGFGLVKNLARKILKREAGLTAVSPVSGQRAFYYKDLKEALPALNYGYGMEIALTLLLSKNGVRPVEIPLKMTHRETGREIKDFIHRGKQFIDILKAYIDYKTGRMHRK